MTTPDHTQRTRLLAGALAVVVAAAAALLVWRSQSSSEDSAVAPTLDVPGVEHVHGLGINPDDGSLIVATHFGSFRLPAKGREPERIGDSYQDTMGFTVAGPDHFLGSGHPDVPGMRAGQPTRLGLIESTDAGVSWKILSLGDEADFHGLAYAHDTVYGWDSGTGRFMVSRDKQKWETRSSVDLLGFAVDPNDENHLVGASPAGLVESNDGGRTWGAADGPALMVIGWDQDGGLWGADSDGTVWDRSDDGWMEKGSLGGEPQAFLVTAHTLYAAAHDADDRTAIYESTDAGQNWKLRYRDPAA